MKKNFAFILTVSMLLSLALTACTGPWEALAGPSTAIVYLFGRHDHFPETSLSRIGDDVLRVCYNTGSVGAIVVDGECKNVRDFDIKPSETRVDDQKRYQIAKENASVIMSELAQMQAAAPEVDTVKAIQDGANMLSEKTADVRKLVIVDNMLSTKGIINHTDERLIYQEPEYIIDQLNDLHAIPDLSFVDELTIYGLGQTSGDLQPRLTDDYKNRLESFWLAFFEAGGCPKERVTIHRTPLTGDRPAEAQYVSVVPVRDVWIDSKDIPTPTPAPTAAPTAEPVISTPVNLLEDVHFHDDSAEIKNRAEALEKLKLLADTIISSPNTFLLLGGCAGDSSTTSESWGMRLSQMRADAIRRLLIEELNVPDTQLIAIGMGSLCLSHKNGLGVGREGEVNRVCWILNSDTPDGQAILRDWLPIN